MEARLQKAKIARTLKGEEVIIFPRGKVVPVTEVTEWTVKTPLERSGELTLSRREVDVLLTVEEAAERVGRATSTIYTWLRDGRLRGERVKGPGPGGEWRIRLADLEGMEMPKRGPKPKGDDDA